MNLELSTESWQVLTVFTCYLIGVAVLGIVSHRFLTRGSFVKEYFLGNRGLGAWVLALTVAATAISGGSFMGFPSLIYSNGWVMALWIASYMIVPIMTMALMGKRINQVARVSGSVTVPDVLRDRFGSPALGILASVMILIFLGFNLVAQFKAGGLVMREALRLPSARAAYLGAEVDAARNLIVHFDLGDGVKDSMKTPLPSENAAFLPERTRVDEGRQEVRVFFDVQGKVVDKGVKFPPQLVRLPWLKAPVDLGYLIGLCIFAFTVVAYTTYGGFWAVTWNDVLEGLVMFVGIVIMAVLAIQAVPSIDGKVGLEAATEHLRQMKPPDADQGTLVYGPGPAAYLPVGLAFSFFLIWSLMSAGQPSAMVRLMSFKDTRSLRRAIVVVAVYYLIAYICLVVIFICARAIFPTQYLREFGSEGQPDSIMPAMARHLAHPLVAGLLMAAPYAAIMSTVAAFLLMISSSLVRDLYQRTINPDVSDKTIKRLSYLVTGTVGLIVLLGAINPPNYLQYVIVFTGTGQGCAFLIPMLMTLYWRRATRQGIQAGMLGGFLAVFGLYILGWLASADPTSGWHAYLQWVPGWSDPRPDSFAPLYIGGVDPVVWGLLSSLVLSVGVSLLTQPDERVVARYFP